jgi:tetratricopeptide (TPR) repeat protein
VNLLLRFSRAFAFLATTATLAAAFPHAAAQQDEYAAGFAAAYNLDYAEARERFEAILRRSPDDGRAHRGLATVAWLEITFARGTVTADEFLGGSTRNDVQLPAPPPAQAASFQAHAARALAIAERRVAARPADADAHYQLGAAVGLIASYTATIEGRILGAFRSARRAYDEHERVLALAPGRKDAGLIVGTYRYLVSTLSLPGRWLAYMAGFGGGRELGIRMMEDAASYAGDSQGEAKFALVLIYNRERRFDDALAIIRQLQVDYPRNRLLWLEAGATAIRAGRYDTGIAMLQEGIKRLEHDRRPRAFGERALWEHKLGVAQLGRRDLTAARASLTAALGQPAREWVKARTHLALGRVEDLSGQRQAALAQYETARRLAVPARDPETADLASAGLRQAFR